MPALPELAGQVLPRQGLRRPAATATSTATRTRSATARRWPRSWSAGQDLFGHQRSRARTRRCCRSRSRSTGTTDASGQRPTARGDPVGRRSRRQDHQHVARRWRATSGRTASPARPTSRRRSTTRCARARSLLAAAGNRGPSGNAVEEPGVCLGVVSVGAVDSHGAVADVLVAAPLPDAHRARRRHRLARSEAGAAYSGDGTSQATAIASAAAGARLVEVPAADRRRGSSAGVLATLDAPHRRAIPAYGYGTINPYRAVTASVPADAPNPVYDAAGAVPVSRSAATPTAAASSAAAPAARADARSAARDSFRHGAAAGARRRGWLGTGSPWSRRGRRARRCWSSCR